MTKHARSNISYLLKGTKVCFTEREIDVISCLICGNSAKSSAKLLEISHHTVKTHIQNIMRKLECNSQEQIINFIESLGNRPLFHEHYLKKFNDNLSSNNIENKENAILSNFRKYIKYGSVCFVIIGLSFLIFLRHKDNDVISNYSVYSEKILLPRTKIIKAVEKIFNKQRGVKIGILAGPGGAGKTTIGRIFLHSQESRLKWEINAETKESIVKSFFDIANILANTGKLKNDLLYIKSSQNHEEKLRQLVSFVSSRLGDYKEWCLLFDNVDDFQTIKDFLVFDKRMEGKILITTRNENLTNAAYFPEGCMVQIKDMAPEEQKELFCNIRYGDNDKLDNKKQEEISGFLKNIPLMPLDVCAAAYYLKSTGDTLENYLNLANKSSAEFEKLNSNLLSEGVSYSLTRYGIITSTFSHILKQNSDFKELLLFICLGDSQNIPKNLRNLKGAMVVNNFLHNLKKHSLIVENEETFSIHRSTQKIGLDYMMSILSDHEKEKYLNDIVKGMTNYTKMRLEPSRICLAGMLPHVESMIKNIEGFSIANKEEYKIKLLLSQFYIFSDTKSKKLSDKLAEKILECNKGKKYICDYDIAVLLSVLSQNYIYTEECKKAEETLGECLRICDYTSGTEGIKTICLSYLAVLHNDRGNDIDVSFKLLEKAKENFPKVEKLWKDIAAIILDDQYRRCCRNYYVNKPEIHKVITLLLNNLKKLGVCEFFYKQGANSKEAPKFVVTLRSALASLYNCVEEYDKALECENEVHYIYEKRREKGASSFVYEANNDVNYGYTLLRVNQVNEANTALTRSISTKFKIDDRYHLFDAFVYRSEANNRLGNYKEAYDDGLKAIELRYTEKYKHNFAKLTNIVCYYNIAIAQYKLDQTPKSLEHFKDFFINAEDFCKGFLDINKLKHLNEINAFKFKKDIKTCLKNSLEIFKSVYGDTHAFVRDYVKNN